MRTKLSSTVMNMGVPESRACSLFNKLFVRVLFIVQDTWFGFGVCVRMCIHRPALSSSLNCYLT